ncbi:MAG: mobile mystery protein A [Candidatus Caenarcaniphilales bacterium]|nr:mobile mystery protein A [Candidatus Caenarcaniphilales bacterium]
MRKKNLNQLKLRQVSQQLSLVSDLAKIQIPSRGWIERIIDALSMSTRQFAKKLRISQPRLQKLKESEVNQRITLRSLSRAAEALDCKLVYAFVPKVSLEEMVIVQAQKKAEAQVSKVVHSMTLEDQVLSEAEIKRQIKDLAEELILEMPRDLWNDN